ncbi:cytoplasmic heat shock protein 70 [Histomonas meleagridis]|uniref:cytoplasmic heat shock protein 70 n=1 Tax=Histomonas meleagridis TaxID=135588 RepID=UPI00355A9C8C|nr:cytoplasmic heat shock protein 70 [Histomonas meleagridis]KAH0801253.1 cytoplasmic heat shock protein 70 [Histomonas meleagridis]
MGKHTTPSYVTFTDDGMMIGSEAKEAEIFNPGNCVFDVKRLIGRKINDTEVQKDIVHWPFKVIPGKNDRPMIGVQWKGETKHFYPEEISAMLLGEMKDLAEKYLRETDPNITVTDAVITVPAYFSDSQRQSTKAAGKIAGLNVLHIINEPTAAAIAYGLRQNFDGPRTILIYDFGGGTFDVSIVRIEGGKYEVVGIGGDSHLGGRDIDNILFEYFADRFQEKHKVDLRVSSRSCSILRAECEKVKERLSNEQKTSIHCQTLFEGITFTDEINRAKFNDLCTEIFEKTIKKVKSVLKSKQLRPEDIDDIVLIGGSSKIPKIKTLLHDLFGKDPVRRVDPDEAVAFGASVNAESFLPKNQDDDEETGIILIDVTPLSLGINVHGDVTSKIIKRNTIIPCEVSKKYKTCHDDQDEFEFKIIEGERTKTENNYLLGTFYLKNIKKAPRGETKAIVTFKVDENGILSVSAKEKDSNNEVKDIKIINEVGRLSNEEVDSMVEAAKRYREEDMMYKERINKMNDFQGHITKTRRKIISKFGKTHEIMNNITEILDWTDQNLTTATIEMIEEKRKQFDNIVKPLIE